MCPRQPFGRIETLHNALDRAGTAGAGHADNGRRLVRRVNLLKNLIRFS